ncbi:hypothetical protein ACWG0P_04270 [Amedibacillus sp. YH-ame6]
MKEITLEMSLKPFKINTHDEIQAVCKSMFTQWLPLVKNAETICVLLWIGDGSELLEYSGDLKEKIEWAKYIGRANEFDGDWNKEGDPEKLSPHAQKYLYMDNPPIFLYEDLKYITQILKEVGIQITGKNIRVGTTFDPGPEFAESEFKYKRHPEICTAGTMGDKSFVVSYETLKGDKCHYRAYPNGIPEGTPFAEFFGKQSQVFLDDMGFDYIWFSNGFGFGAENWATIGPLFSGEKFTNDKEKILDVKQKTLQFWKEFREGCPHYEVQTRGTNLSVGIDFATDGVDTKDIYDGNFNIVPPPNSPWAALDKNFGLEMSGFMSRIAKLPNDSGFMYRFYLHDPWWMNSPWFDRYEGEPHDIYLPLSIARINQSYEIEVPSYMNILTVDTSLGEMPEDAVQHVLPHMNQAIKNMPDQAAPIVWVYPFDEYQSANEEGVYELEKSFYEDWYITSAINTGLPLNTVISTDNFENHQKENANYFKGSIILSPVPRKNSAYEKALFSFLEENGNVLLYGSLTNASKQLLHMLNLKICEGIDGRMKYIDFISEKAEKQGMLYHDAVLSNGKIDTVLDDDKKEVDVISKVTQGSTERICGIHSNHGGKLVWLRGTNCNVAKKGANLLQPLDTSISIHEEEMLRRALCKFDLSIEFIKQDETSKEPALTIHRHNNAFYFSGYVPNTTIGTRLKFPLGIPVMIGHEVLVENGYGIYHFPRSFHKECRVFVQQKENGTISMSEYGPVSVIMKRRVLLEGLKDATIYVFPEAGKEQKCELLLNSEKPNIIGEDFTCELVDTVWGKAYKAEHVTGKIMYSMEFDDVTYLEDKRRKLYE